MSEISELERIAELEAENQALRARVPRANPSGVYDFFSTAIRTALSSLYLPTAMRWHSETDGKWGLPKIDNKAKIAGFSVGAAAASTLYLGAPVLGALGYATALSPLGYIPLGIAAAGFGLSCMFEAARYVVKGIAGYAQPNRQPQNPMTFGPPRPAPP